MKVYVPTPINMVDIPTLAEVRWAQQLQFGTLNDNGTFFVGRDH
jgi:hypothetical protein